MLNKDGTATYLTIAKNGAFRSNLYPYTVCGLRKAIRDLAMFAKVEPEIVYEVMGVVSAIRDKNVLFPVPEKLWRRVK